MDRALGQACEAKGKLEVAEKAHIEIKKRLKDTLFHLAEAEKSRKNVESDLAGF